MAKKVQEETGVQEESDTLRAERKRARKLAKIERREAKAKLLPTEKRGGNEDATTDPTERQKAKDARKAEKRRLKKLGPTTLVRHGAEGEPQKSGQETSQSEEKQNQQAGPTLALHPLAETGDMAAVDESTGDSRRRQKHKKSKSSEADQAGEDMKELQSPSIRSEQLLIPDATPYTQSSALTMTPQSEIDSFMQTNMITIEDDLTSTPLRPIMNFSHLPDDSRQVLQSTFKQFQNPTPIQSGAWPFALSGNDVIGVAETGSGKTLAFGIPCLRHIQARKDIKRRGGRARAVIVSPTRELAVQIHEQIALVAKPAGVESVCVYGGVPKEEQRAALKKASIVIATPGRLNDLVEEGSADLSGVTYLVLDEADRMLDKGFEDAIRQIVSVTRGNSDLNTDRRQTLMFTATWPPSVRELASTFMRNPVKINIGDNPSGELRANARITQTVEIVDPRDKEQRLLQLLKQHQSGKSRDDRILVFCLYKKEAARVENFLRSKGLRASGIHGDMSQDKRSASLDSFKRGKTPVLVATDVAARGLDIPAVKVVINVTFPLTVEDYVHRIGRTGRAGADGLAITLFTEHDKAQSGALINVLKAAKQPVPDALLKFGTTVKRKQHEAYGAFFKETDGAPKATKIKFDD